MIQIYCGDGKGKTTAAVGAAVRFAGCGGRVLFSQFMKSGTSSEISILKSIQSIDVFEGYSVSKFSFMMNKSEREKAAIGFLKQLEDIKKLSCENNYGMIIADELAVCVSCGFVPEEEAIEFLKNVPAETEIIITGRNPSESLLEYADYVSEIKKIKHPFDRGVDARRGIEF